MFNLKRLITPVTVTLTALVGITPLITESAWAESIKANNLNNEFNNGVLIAQPAVDTGATDGENEDGDLDPRSEELDSGNVDLRPNDEEYREEMDLDDSDSERLNREDMNREYEEDMNEDMQEDLNYSEPNSQMEESYQEY